jgi:hypothetical protein
MTTLSTKTGTVSTTNATVVVSDNTGISVGQAVTGTYIPASTTVIGIASTTVTLSNRPHSIARAGTYVPTTEEYYYEENYNQTNRTILTGQQINIDTTGLSDGMIVFGSNGIDTTIASVGSGVIYLNGYGDLYFDQVDVQLYFLPASPGSATYTFASNAKYTFRTPDTALPFGSYPGAGLSQ